VCVARERKPCAGRSSRAVRVDAAAGESRDRHVGGSSHQENLMAFDTLEMSLTVLDQLATVEPKIRAKRKSLADEIGRAAESIALNVSEARQRAGLDKPDLFRRAAGSAAELTTALRIARARGFISVAEHAAIEAPLDRVRAMLWRLTH
jgi:four helix bundle protein